MKTLCALLLLALFTAIPAYAQKSSSAASTTTNKSATQQTYKQNETLQAAQDFFGNGAAGLAKVIEKAFKEHGEPVGFIRGEEAGGAVGVGLRYGRGDLVLKGRAGRKVYWQGPSIGFDFGGNAAKVFVLVYRLPNEAALFQRFPGVEGSAYFVGGVGINYNQRNSTILAPVRLGVGWRLGVGVGYMHFTPKKHFWPF